MIGFDIINLKSADIYLTQSGVLKSRFSSCASSLVRVWRDKAWILCIKSCTERYTFLCLSICDFPINKIHLSKAILANNSNLKKIVKVVHKEIRLKLNSFLKKNKNKKFIILDIPLLLENNINTKKDILIYVDSKKIDILKNLKKTKNFNIKILNKFREIQLPLDYKKNSSHFIIKNKFTKKSVNVGVQKILKKLENERNSSWYRNNWSIS